jgi:acyl-coenzyme A synthetase/AMP-(fatty) acid ligase
MRSRSADSIAAALARPTGVIADGQSSLAFPAIPAAIEELSEAFDRAGIAPEDCVCFGCDNSVASAVVLLALLHTDRNFVLRPRQDRGGPTATDAPAPEAFCRLSISAGRRFQTQDAVNLRTADISITITRNDRWRANLPPGPPSYFLPTSGTTGPAKLVRHRHDLFLPGCANCVERLQLTSADRIAIPVPLFHMYGLRAAFGPGLIAGAAMDLQANSNALRFIARERDFAPNVAFLTPSFAETLLAVRKAPRPYRLTVMAGDGFAPDRFAAYEARHGCVVNLYGSTELGAVAAGRPDDPMDVRRDRIGPFLAGVSLCPDPPLPTEDTDPGLLWFHHPAGFQCYVDPQGRDLRDADGGLPSGDCFCSGDIGAVAGGYLTVTGRTDDRLKRDGVFVACAEVAEALRRIDGLDQVMVLAGDMTRRGRALVAFCVPRVMDRWEPATLRKAALAVLPPRAVPDSVFLLQDLPRTATGKIDRQDLRRLYAARVNRDNDAN